MASTWSALALAADPQIASLVDDPDPVPAGGLYTYQLRVDNNAADAATGTRLLVTVPAGATFVSASPASQNCAPLSATQVECNLGALGGNGADVRNLTLTWRALGPGPTTIAASAVISAANDTNAGNNTQNATTTVISGANLGLTKSGAPNPVVGGANVTYTLTGSNTGPNDSGNLVLTDNLPPSVSFVSAAGSGWSCAHAAGVVTCSRPGPHPVGAAIPAVSVVGKVNASGGTITNSATIAPAAAGGIADPDSANNTATADTAVLPGADVRIAQKTVTSGTPAVAGANVTFQIQPRNSGPAAAVNARVTDTLPAGWTFVSAGGPNWACANAGAVVTCTRANFPAGASDNITVVATAPNNAAVGPTGTAYTNTASVASDTPDPTAGNNSGSVNINVLPDGADLRLAKNKTPNPVAQGSNMTSTITVTNNGPRIATGPLRVVEALTGEAYVSATGTGWTCTPSGAVIVCEHANASNLAVNASLPVLTIVTTATASGTVSNTACTGGSVPAGAGGASASPPAEGDANPTNDCATVGATSTTVQPDLAIAKTTSTPGGGDKIVSTGEASVTYTLVVSNVSVAPQSATGVRITDTVPGFIAGRTTISSPVVATASGASSATFNCAIAAATVTCTQTGGVLAQGETVTVPITVNRALQDGSFTNTANVANTAEGDPNSGNNSASDTVTIEPIADVEMTGKSVTPASVRAGENATYVLSYRNNGPSPALGVVLGDTLAFAPGDAGATVVSIASTKGGSSCAIAAGAVLLPGSDSFNCTIGTLANGETQTVTLVVRPNYQPGNAARTFGNTATVSTTSVENPAGGDNGNNSRSASLGIAAAAIDLLVNKTDVVDPAPFTVGAAFVNYRVRVTSNGPSFGTNVRVTETMTPPPGKRVRFVCDTTALGGATCNAVPLCSVANVTSGAGAAIPAFTCSVPAGSASTGPAVGELASGRSKDFFLRFEVLDQPAPTGDIFNNVATVSANEPDTFVGNDTESEQTTVRQRVDLRVTKAPVPATVALRQPFNWVINVVNNGPGNSLQTDLTDTLPVGVQVTGPITWTRTLQPGSGTCTLTGQAVACALGQLDATGGATVTVPARIVAFPAGGTLANSATVDTDPNKTGGIDDPGGNNVGVGTVTVTRSSLAGTVFQDRDRAGANGGVPQAAAGEPRIAGVGLRLTGTDAYGNAVDLVATTDANGNYGFGDLSPAGSGGYTLTQTQPAGFVNGPVDPPTAGANAPTAGGSYAAGGASGNSGFAGIVLGANVAAGNYNFPEVRRPSLGGFVYLDGNSNGVRDPGADAPIAGATVRLLDANTLAVVATVTTDAGGAYSFTGLDPFARYTLEEPLPAAPASLQNGPVNPGQVGGVACAAGCTAQPNVPAAGTDRIAAIDLSAGADGTAFNFGERQLTAVSGLVFVDRNRDNTLGAGEAGRVGGVTLRLVQGADCSSGSTLQTTTSAADGSYAFANVLAFQDYLVCQTQPVGYGTGSANGVAGSNQIAIGNLPAGGSANNNFGETLASLAGSVYADSSPATPAQTNNGVRDPGETGIANVPITLTGRDINGAAVSRSALTDASGNYIFDDLLQSDAAGYTLVQGAIPPASGSFNDGRDTVGSAGGSNAVNDALAAIVLGAGTQASAYLFGELPIAPITGTVYVDRDRNNALGPLPTDGRIGGVTLTLYAGSSCSGAPLGSTTSDASGNYTFSGVSVGLTYTVCQAQPNGYADGGVNPGANAASTAANAITISGLPAAGSAGNHFSERVGSIAGSVYLDANNDGTRQGGEAGIAGVTVTLTGSDINGAPVNRSTATDASGNYVFADLLAAGAGGYAVTEQAAQPVVGGVNTLNGRTSAGTIAGAVSGTASGVGTRPSAVSAIALPAGADSVANHFGEILPVGLSGTVFIDLDNNGVQNAPVDAGLPGVTIVITGTDDTGAAVSRTVTSAADGRYSVPDLRPGTYTITQPDQPAGTANGQTVPGSAGGSATAPTTAPSAIGNIVLGTPGASATGNNFAETPSSSAINGRVWLDANNNGLVDGGEAGIAGVALQLSGTDGAGRPVTRSATTDASGRYAFDGLAPGSYTVTEPTQPAGTLNGSTLAGSAGGSVTPVATTPSAVSAIALAVGQTSSANNFGEVPPGQIAGRVYADNNNNGSVDALEAGLGGQTLLLSGTDDLGSAVSLTATTAADGSYAFPSLRPGTYTVTQPAQPAGTVSGLTTAGTLGGSATGPASAPSAISGIVLPPGGNALNNNFGELGNSPDLRVAKRHDDAVLTVTKTATYRIGVRNVGEVATSGAYTVSDRLPAGLTLVTTPTGPGWTCSGAAPASSFTCTSSTALAAGAASADFITVVVNVGPAAAAASPVNNVVLVDGGGEIDARRPFAAERDAFSNNPAALPPCTPAIEFNACRDPALVQAAASLSGTVWYDTGAASRLLDGGDRRLPGWQVEVVAADGRIVGRATTGSDGGYRVADLIPGVEYTLRFREPQSGVVFGYPVNGESAPGSSGASCSGGLPPPGTASSCVGTGANPQLRVVLAAGQDLPQQSLPVDPSGVVYDSGLRQPVPGSVVTLAPTGACPGWNPSAAIVGATLGGYAVAGDGISMTVGNDGFYQFLLAPGAPPSCTIGLAVTPPAGYTFQSTAIPPGAGPLVPPGGAGAVFNVQPQATAPSGPVGSGTTYYLAFTSGSAGANVVHNHIPLDPFPPTGLSLAKTGDKSVAEVGDSIRYSITVQVNAGPRPRQTTVVDHLPAGFTYIRGTAMVNDVTIADPAGGVGPTLAFNLGAMPAGNQLVLRYRVRVGVGAMQGDGVNRAAAHACGVPAGCVGPDFTPLAGSVPTNEARFRVRVSGGVFAPEACLLGKIFVDCNGNHVQDAEELGIPGVRLVLNDGTTLISDSEGKYSYCGLPPKSHVLKVDPSTLPRGSRLTTSSNRNLGDAGSLWLDLKNGELHRGDFIEGSCSNTVLEQTKARRAQGEVRAPEVEKRGGPALRFDSKAHGLDTFTSPQQGTDGANQQTPTPRTPAPATGPVLPRTEDESTLPTPSLPMNRPPPTGRDSATAPAAPASGGARGTR